MSSRPEIAFGLTALVAVVFFACSESDKTTPEPLSPDSGRNDLSDGGRDDADSSTTDAGLDAEVGNVKADAGDAAPSCCPLEGHRFHDDENGGCREQAVTIVCKPKSPSEEACLHKPLPVCIVSQSDPSLVFYVTEDGPDPAVDGFVRCAEALATKASQAPYRASCP